MAEGEVHINAEDWGKLSTMLAALPRIEGQLRQIEQRLSRPVHEECSEHTDCSKAAFGARKFQYVLLGGIIVVNTILVPLIVGLMLK